jgi:ergothioneine biosynthesis protein EgtB
MERLIRESSDADFERVGFLITTGIQHEQQHQELLVTEVKHILGCNVPELREPYRPARGERRTAPEARWVPFQGGLQEIGNLEGGWCWDNEMPVHKAWLEDFALLNRLVTNREYLEFVEDGGYSNPLLWLSNGWARVKELGWTAPLYWEGSGDGGWQVWTLSGVRDLDPEEPVCHVSFYEAEAYARWKDARLPTEREWEHAARVSGFPGEGNFLDSGALHPRAAGANVDSHGGSLVQMGGDVWEWTTSHYEPYPGYRPFEGPLVEYNGKFMDNQRVLRGGSCATPANHIRASYRNFWPAEARFQFTGIRLARLAEDAK